MWADQPGWLGEARGFLWTGDVAVRGEAETVVASVGELAEVGSAVMVVLKADGGGMMRTREGSIAEGGSSVFGWEKVKMQSKRVEYRGVLEICVAQDFLKSPVGRKDG